MIRLTRLNGHGLIVNDDLIKYIESTPDTTLTLVSGEKLMVSEAPDEVIARVIQFRKQLHPPILDRKLEL